MLSRRLLLATSAAAAATAQPAFRWPEGKSLAVSLTWDDARLSQIDTGLKLLEQLKLKGTFYLSLPAMSKRVDGWREMIRQGHEIGNHSTAHACTANYRFTRPLEDFTLEEMAADIDNATAQIESTLGVRTRQFAYPCGLKFVGRGRTTRSYVPLIADRFQTGRGYLDEMPNVPRVCDFSQLMGTHFDGRDFAWMKAVLDKAAQDNRWVIFAGHEIGKSAPQTTDVEALRQLADYLKDPANGIWVDTVGAVATYLSQNRA
jgi:peptidoglycan/xylan/chitin deacetylase (PgdA/CDA1 family)